MQFKRIIHDILDLGFHKGAKNNNQLRAVDFNQGLDARKLTAEKMKLLRTAIRPLRLALDSSGMVKTYVAAVKLACQHGVPEIGTYVLFNYRDTPKSFYDRLRLSVELNESIGAKVTSFPMRYIPLTEQGSPLCWATLEPPAAKGDTVYSACYSRCGQSAARIFRGSVRLQLREIHADRLDARTLYYPPPLARERRGGRLGTPVFTAHARSACHALRNLGARAGYKEDCCTSIWQAAARDTAALRQRV